MLYIRQSAVQNRGLHAAGGQLPRNSERRSWVNRRMAPALRTGARRGHQAPSSSLQAEAKYVNVHEAGSGNPSILSFADLKCQGVGGSEEMRT